jgi:hypothetical protein
VVYAAEERSFLWRLNFELRVLRAGCIMTLYLNRMKHLNAPSLKMRNLCMIKWVVNNLAFRLNVVICEI